VNPATHLLLAPVVVPVAAALLLLVFPRPGRARRIFASGALLLVFASALWMGWIVAERGGLAIRLGSWPRPMAIVLALDALSATFLSFVSLTALVCVLHGFAGTPTARAHPLRLPLAMLLLAGVNLTLMTADLFNMFVAFEVMLVSSYALLTLETDDRRIRRAIPYLKINIIGSTLFLAACGLTYGWLGTLDLGSVSLGLEQHRDDPRTAWLAALLLLVVGIKSAIFPLFYWLPRSYPALPPALAALFGGLLTKIGIYVMIRLLVTVFPSGLGMMDRTVPWCFSKVATTACFSTSQNRVV